MLEKAAVEGFLKAFADEVVAKSKLRANRSTGKGAESIDYELEVFKQSFSLNFEMAAHMYFQDRGVAGIKSGRSLSGFAYTDKMMSFPFRLLLFKGIFNFCERGSENLAGNPVE